MAVQKIPGHARVFISYSHDSDEHRLSVLALAQTLRDLGVDAWIDQFEEGNPPREWTAWMREQRNAADVVLVVATENYKKRAEGDTAPDEGRGVRWEAMLAIQDLYSAHLVEPAKFVPVVLGDEPSESIPDFLTGTTEYRLKDFSRGQLDPLVRRLTGQPSVVPRKLGPVEARPPVDLLPTGPISAIPKEVGASYTGLEPDVATDAALRAGTPAWQWPVSGPWVAFIVEDGIRLMHVAGKELVGCDPGGGRARSRIRWPVACSQVIAAGNGTALIGLGEGRLMMATVDNRGEVEIRPGTAPAPENDLTLLGALLQRDVVKVIASSAAGTVEFRLGTSLEPFGFRQLSDSTSRAAVPLSRGHVRVNASGDLTVLGDVPVPVRALFPGGWKSLDHAGGPAASVFAGVRVDAEGDRLQLVHQTAEGFRTSAVLLEEPTGRVQVARTTHVEGPTAVLVQQGDTVVGWPAEDA